MSIEIHNSNRRTTCAAAKVQTALMLLGATCGISLTGHVAADEPERQTKVVSYADLNLSSRAGAETMYLRLRAAAEEVCRRFEDKTLKQFQESRGCFDQAIARAVEEIDRPMLTAYHLAKNGKGETRVAIASE